MPELSLFLARNPNIELERSYFRNLPFEVHGLRGGQGGASLRCFPVRFITVPWTTTAAALCVIALRAAALGIGSFEPRDGNLNTALEYALEKSSHWVHAVLGVDEHGRPLSTRLLTPVESFKGWISGTYLSFNSKVLTSLNIYLGGEVVTQSSALLELAAEIYESRQRRNISLEACGFRSPRVKNLGLVASGKLIRRPDD